MIARWLTLRSTRIDGPCHKLGAIYDRAPTQTQRHRLPSQLQTLGGSTSARPSACKLTWALRQTILRPVLLQDGLQVQVLSPEWSVVVPNRDNPMRIDAIMRARSLSAFSDMTGSDTSCGHPEHHGSTWTRCSPHCCRWLATPKPQPLQGCAVHLAHAEWPEAWDVLETSPTLDPVTDLPEQRSRPRPPVYPLAHVVPLGLLHRRVAFKGIPGKDFDPNMIVDPRTPGSLDLIATVEVTTSRSRSTSRSRQY